MALKTLQDALAAMQTNTHKFRCFFHYKVNNSQRHGTDVRLSVIDYIPELAELFKDDLAGTIVQSGDRILESFFPNEQDKSLKEDFEAWGQDFDRDQNWRDHCSKAYYAEFESEKDFKLVMYGLRFAYGCCNTLGYGSPDFYVEHWSKIKQLPLQTKHPRYIKYDHGICNWCLKNEAECLCLGSYPEHYCLVEYDHNDSYEYGL